MAAFRQMHQHRQHQQHQGHHQLPPLTPPAPAALHIVFAGTGGGLGAGFGGEAAIFKRRQHPFQGLAFAGKAQPGTARHQIDAGLLHPRLLQQGALHSAHAPPALHALHIQENSGVGTSGGGATHSRV